jgi:hypothetical protein
VEPGQGLPHPPDRLAHPLFVLDEGEPHVAVSARPDANANANADADAERQISA